MADPDTVYDLAAKVESNSDIDKRVSALHSLQAELERGGYVVEADAVTSAIKTALKQSNHLLSNASLAFIPTYASLIYAGDGTESHAILNHNVRTLINSAAAQVIDKLGDQKERVRDAARTALIELCNAAYSISSGHLTTSTKGKDSETPLGIFERTLRDNGLAAKSPRIREQAVLLLPILQQSCDRYPVRPLLPITVDLLSDADGTVREGARGAIVALFSNASPGAKADLKKELEKRGTRKQTAEAILREVLASPSVTMDSIDSTPFQPAATTQQRQTSRSEAAYKPIAAPPPSVTSAAASAAADDIKPVYIASRSDLERTFTAMLPCYEGRESEHNWLNREQSMIKIRGLLVSGAHRQIGGQVFVGQIKVAQEGILKSIASLRTTLSMHAVHLVAELAVELGDDLAPCVEPFTTALIGMSGFTKKLIANATQESAAAIMTSVHMRPLFLQLIWQGYQDKNVATRAFAAEHLCTILSHHAPSRKHAIEAHGGLDIVEKCLRKGASDSNPAARSNSRKAFWIYHQYWAAQANAILNSLDPATKKQVMATAPSDVDVEAVVEHKPKAAVPLRSKPGGASSAILQAKRAAAMKVTQERERLKAEGAAAAHEARLASAREAAEAEYEAAQEARHTAQRPQAAATVEQEEFATPVPAKRTGSFMPSRHRPAQQADPLSVIISPEARRRIETAVATPLPSSPTEPRAARSVSSTVASKAPEQVGLNRNRAVSSSSFSSQSSSASGPSPVARSKPSNTSFAPARQREELNLADLSLNNDDTETDIGDVTQQPRSSTNSTEDDTIQLGAPEDASMDLMGMDFNSPFKLPKAASVHHQLDGSDSTPSAKVQREALTPPTAKKSTNGSKTTGAGSLDPLATPGTAVKRSAAVPRSMSMMISGSNSPMSQFARSPSQRTLSSSSNASSNVKVTPTRVRPTAVSSTSSGSSKSSETSAATRQTSKSWISNKATRLEQTPPATMSSSPVKSRPETWTYIQALSSGTADLREFRKLAKLSSEFKVADSEIHDNVGDDDAPDSPSILRRGPLSAGTGTGKLDMRAEEQTEFTSGTLAWQHAGLFDTLFSAVKLYLVPESSESRSAELRLSAQVLLHRMVENQYPLFPASGREREMLDSVMQLIQEASTTDQPAQNKSSASVVTRKGSLQASESILSCWSAKVDSILGFDMLLSLLNMYRTPASSVLTSVVLRSGFATLLCRIPAELVLEDFLPRLKPALNEALTSTQADSRLNATTLLKKLNDHLRAEAIESPHDRIFTTLGLENNQSLMDLLMYYFSRK